MNAFVALAKVALAVVLLTPQPARAASKDDYTAWYQGTIGKAKVYAELRFTEHGSIVGGAYAYRRFPFTNQLTHLHLEGHIGGTGPIKGPVLREFASSGKVTWPTGFFSGDCSPGCETMEGKWSSADEADKKRKLPFKLEIFARSKVLDSDATETRVAYFQFLPADGPLQRFANEFIEKEVQEEFARETARKRFVQNDPYRESDSYGARHEITYFSPKIISVNVDRRAARRSSTSESLVFGWRDGKPARLSWDDLLKRDGDQKESLRSMIETSLQSRGLKSCIPVNMTGFTVWLNYALVIDLPCGTTSQQEEVPGREVKARLDANGPLAEWIATLPDEVPPQQ